MALIQTSSFTLSIYSQGDQNAAKLALVIPGKCDSKDYAHMHSLVDFLATKGFFALTFDPPGTWGSEGYGNKYSSTNYLKAIDEIIAFYGNKPTLLVGHSRGGKITIVAGSRNPHIVAYAAIMSQLPEREDIKDDKEWKEKGFETTLRALPPGTGPRVKEFPLPYSFLEDQNTYFLTPEIKACTKPKMMVWGKQDTIVPFGKVKKTYDVLSQPKELHEVDSDHDYWLRPEIMQNINVLVADFIEKYSL